MSTHSIIPPSSAHIWGKPDGCTGWVLMSQMYPDADDCGNGEDAEGTATHEIGAFLIERAALGDFINDPNQIVGNVASNGIVFNDEMFDAAKMYADNVTEVMRRLAVFGGPNFGIEQSIKIPIVHEMSYGTPDMFLYDQRTQTLYIWDFKFGFIIHEVYENWQLLNYLAGLISHLNINGLLDQRIKVHLRVIQPRANHRDGPIREWVTTLSNLRGYFNILHTNAHIALGNHSELKTGSHCRFCSARHACEPALKAGVGLYEVAAKPVPLELSPEALGVQLAIIKRAISQLEYLESGFDEQVKNLIRSGANVPGWVAEMGKGRLKWNRSINEVIALGDMLNKNLRKPVDVKTPNQAIKDGIDPGIIKLYSKKPETGLKVVPDTGNKAKKVFSS